MSRTCRGIAARTALSVLLTAGVLFAAGCGAGRAGSGDPGAEGDGLVMCAQRFRALIEMERYAQARALMSEDPRRWFAPREGPGQPWEVGPGAGPWSAWDEHFRSTGEVVAWHEEGNAAVAVVRETNDYFRLLERGHVTNRITYFFDDRGRIDGLLIDGVGERPSGRTEEFLAWAREHEREELEALMPDGEIDPSGDHALKFRALLERWRVAAGLEPLPLTGSSPATAEESAPACWVQGGRPPAWHIGGQS